MADTAVVGFDKPRRLEALTALRFFAAAVIVLHHSPDMFGLDWPVAADDRLGQGVTFFFVLSGFILAYVYPQVPTLKSAGRFFQARIARIWPAHLAAFLVCMWLLELPLGMVAPFNVFLVHAWVPYSKFFFSYNSPSWSISTELFFYLSFPLLIFRWRETWAAKLALSSLLLACVVVVAAWLGLPAYPETGLTSTGLVYIHPLARLLEFVFGMSCAHYFSKERWPLDVSVKAATGLEVGSLLLAVAATLLLVGSSATIHETLGRVAGEWFDRSGLFGVFGVVIVVFAAERGIISRALTWHPLVILGEISFSIYLFHYTFFRYYQVNKHLYSEWSVTFSWLLFCVLTLVASYCCWLFIERPARQCLVLLGRSKAARTGKITSKGGGSFPSATRAGAALVGLACAGAVAAYPIWREYQSFQLGPSVVPTAVRPGGACSLDGASVSPDGIISFVKGGRYMRFSGWAIETESESVPEKFYVTLTHTEAGNSYVVEGQRHSGVSLRPDVAQFFGSDKYLQSGWDALVDTDALPDGVYRVHGVQLTGDGYRTCDTSMFVGVNKGVVALAPAVHLLSGTPFQFTLPWLERGPQIGGRCSVDGGVVETFGAGGGVNGNRARLLKITGWAIDEVAKDVPERVDIRLVPTWGVGSYLARGRRLREELPRPDVAQRFGDARLLLAGWELSADGNSIPPGEYKVKVIQSDGIRSWECATKRRLRIDTDASGPCELVGSTLVCGVGRPEEVSMAQSGIDQSDGAGARPESDQAFGVH